MSCLAAVTCLELLFPLVECGEAPPGIYPVFVSLIGNIVSGARKRVDAVDMPAFVFRDKQRANWKIFRMLPGYPLAIIVGFGYFQGLHIRSSQDNKRDYKSQICDLI